MSTVEPDEVRIDATRDIPELYRDNNNWRSKGLCKKSEPIKLEFLIGDNEATKKNIFWTPVIGANDYDKFMIGLAVHNLGIPFNRFQYLVAPMYSFGRQMVSGIGEFSYTFLPTKTLKISRIGLSIKSFKDSIYPTRKSDGAYLAISPYWNTKFVKCKNSPISNFFIIQGILKYDILGGLREDYFGGFAKYTFDYSLPDHKLSVSVRTDIISAIETDMARLNIESTYKFRYIKNSMKRWVELRGFVGNTYHLKTSDPGNYRYTMALSGSSGAQDLFFEDYYFGRNNISGIWSQQRDENMGGFKSTSFYGATTHWMASGNLYCQLPIPKIGIFGLFADAGAFHNGKTVNTAFNAGLGIRLGKIFGLYFPIYMSKELEASFGNSNYAEKIRFTLKLNVVGKGLKLSSLLN